VDTAFECRACHQIWTAAARPVGCPRCGSRLLESRAERDARESAAGWTPDPGRDDHSRRRGTRKGITLYAIGHAGWVLAPLAMVLVTLGMMAAESGGPLPESVDIALGLVVIGLFVVWLVCTVLFVTFFWLKMYRGWKHIDVVNRVLPGRFPRHSPAAALGLLFVPFFNAYWCFVAYVGFARRFNALVEHGYVRVRPVSVAVPMTFCVLSCVGIPVSVAIAIPEVGSYFLPLHLIQLGVSQVLLFIFVVQMNRATNDLAEVRW